MAYLVLARKYRPRRFDDMVGQPHVTRTLRHALAAGRVHHAYLFAGARGLGKTTAARILARALVCARGPAADPCDACESCTLALSGGHPDVVEIDGASHNKVDDVRDLRDRVHYMPQMARRKIYIVDEVHMLSTSAFNALLKTLEEPPEHVHFVFATTEAHRLPATILSRVVRLDFRRVEPALLAQHLARVAEREGLCVEPSACLLVARAAEGSVRDAMTLLDQVTAFADADTVRESDAREVLGLAEPGRIADLLDAVVRRDPAGAMQVLTDLLAGGREVGALLVQLLEAVRTLAVYMACDSKVLSLTEGEEDRLRAQAEAVPSREAVLGWFDRLSHAGTSLSQHPAPRLLLETVVLDMAASPPLEDVVALLERTAAPVAPSPQPAGPGAGNGPRSSRANRARRGEPSPRTASDGPDPLEASLRAALAGAAAPASAGRDGRDAPPRRDGHGRSPRAGRRSTRGRPSAPSEDPDPSATGSPQGDAKHRAKESAAAPLPPSGPAPSAAPEDGHDSTPTAPPGFAPPAGWNRWEAFVRSCDARDRFLGGVLREVGFVALDAGRLHLRAEAADFAREQLRGDGQVGAAFARALAETFGPDVEVVWSDGPPSLPEAPSLARVDALRHREHSQRARARAAAHPAVRRLVELFDARLEEVEPLDTEDGRAPPGEVR